MHRTRASRYFPRRGKTKYLQPLDVCIMKPFKDYVKALYNAWIQEDPRPADYTKSGNRRPPPRDIIVRWVHDAWQKVSVDLVKKSFQVTGIVCEREHLEMLESKLAKADTFGDWVSLNELRTVLLDIKNSIVEATVYEPDDAYHGDGEDADPLEFRFEDIDPELEYS